MKALLIDIETAPHLAAIWGPKQTYIQPKNIIQPGYTLCFAAKELGKRGVTFHSAHHDGQEAMVKAAWELLHDADAVIHYNGSKFDVPTLNADFVEHGLTPPSHYHQIDLLKTARGQFRLYSNKLDEVAKWLGVGAKVQHKGMELWLDCMNGCDKAWKIMRRYNIGDVTLLERVYLELLPWIKQHPNRALYSQSDAPVCTRCGSEKTSYRGYVTSKTQKYRRYQCNDCGGWDRERVTSVSPDERQNIRVAV